MTDTEIILDILKDQKPHHILEIMQRGRPGTINWAVRSRIADIRKRLRERGMTIATKLDPTDQQAIYQLVPMQGELLNN